MNATNITSPVDDGGKSAGIIFSVALVVVIILALAGNAIVCMAFYRASNLRSLTVIFILSLAVTDILVASVSIPIWLYFQLNQCFTTKANQCNMTLYTTWKSLDVLFSTASIMNLCAISIDRLIAITMPLKYQTIMTMKRALVALLSIWIYAVILSALITSVPSYPLFIFIVAFIAPLLVMIISYSRIFKVALNQARRVFPVRQAYYFKRELKAAKTLAIVMGSFILCWAPFFLANLIAFYYNDLGITSTTSTGIKFLHYVNSALNPVIYSCTNREFRVKILRVLPCKCGDRRQQNIMERVVFWTSSLSPSHGGTSFRQELGQSVKNKNNEKTHENNVQI